MKTVSCSDCVAFKLGCSMIDEKTTTAPARNANKTLVLKTSTRQALVLSDSSTIVVMTNA